MADEFDITATHPKYGEFADKWSLMRKACDGEDAVKAAGEEFLPMKSAMAAITDTARRARAYSAYKSRAEFPEILSPTIRGLMGMIHSKETSIELPSALEPLREKATADELSLQGLHQRVTAELLRVGRFGLMPGIDEASGGVYLSGYLAETIVNWDAPRGELVYLVLDETANERDELTNKWKTARAYLECRFTEGLGLETRTWHEVEGSRSDGKPQFMPDGDWQIAAARGGRALERLPFTFVDVMDLTPAPDEVPLYGLAKLALRYYRMDADYTTALHMTAEPTPWVSGVSVEAAPDSIGAANIWVLESENAKAGMLEFTGAGLQAQEKAQTNTLERAIMFGAQLFADNKRTAESGEAIRLRLGSQTSTLKMIAVQGAAGLERCLKDAAAWMGADPEQVVVTPNLDFVDHELSPQEILALVTGWQSGAYSKLTLFENMQRGGVVDPGRTFEEEQDAIEADMAGVIAPQ